VNSIGTHTLDRPARVGRRLEDTELRRLDELGSQICRHDGPAAWRLTMFYDLLAQEIALRTLRGER
jgi:hypothetical protein